MRSWLEAGRRTAAPRQNPAAAGVQGGHRLDLLLDAHAAWQSLRADLRSARICIDIELYMLVEDAVGKAFVADLLDAVQRGVRVRMLLDAVGSMGLSLATRLAMQRTGVALRVYRPPSRNWPLERWIHRDHRKIVLVDGHIGYVLGMNVAREYFALTPGAATWADAGVRVEGPLIAQLIDAFEASWADGQGQTHDVALATPPPSTAGTGLARAVFNDGPGHADVHRRYLRAIRAATQRVWLAHSYFLPSRRMDRALRQAARRGVDVRVLVPDLRVGDVMAVALAADHAVGRLLAAGVRVFALQDRMMHAKFAVVDQNWWTLGSANLDHLSRTFNLESNILGSGLTEVELLAAYFDRMATEALESTWETWRHRPIWRRWLARGLWQFRAWL